MFKTLTVKDRERIEHSRHTIGKQFLGKIVYYCSCALLDSPHLGLRDLTLLKCPRYTTMIMI
jgi:hypothetical protein